MAIIGIDLGTTNSLVSYWKEGTVKLILILRILKTGISLEAMPP